MHGGTGTTCVCVTRKLRMQSSLLYPREPAAIYKVITTFDNVIVRIKLYFILRMEVSVYTVN